MTVPSTPRRAGPFAGNDVTTLFPFTFKVFATSDVQVAVIEDDIETVLVLDSGYSVALNPNQDTSPGGTVTYPISGTPLATGDSLAVVGRLPYDQVAELPSGGNFSPQVITNALDRATMQIQQLADQLGQTVRASEINGLDALPGIEARANKLLGFDAAGQPVALVGVDAGSAAALQLDLIDATSGAKNAGMVGLGPALTYPALSLGKGVLSAGVTPTMCGAVGDGSADDTEALQAWAASTYTRVGEAKTFKVTETINLGANPNIDFRGMILDGRTGSSWTDSAVVKTVGTLTSLPALSVSPAKGAVSLTFASAHGLVANDVVIVYNPTNGSWSAVRTYYRAGEFVQAFGAPTASTLTLWSPLYAGYTAAAVTMHKLTQQSVGLRNLTILCPTSGVRGLFVSLATRVRLDNIVVSGSTYSTIDVDRSFDTEITGTSGYVNDNAAGDRYGLAINNCQSVKVIGGRYAGRRHGISIGGSDVTGAVPVRDCRVSGATITNDFASSVPAADAHGNAEAVRYAGCTIHGGVEFGGRDCYYEDCEIYEAGAGNGALVYGSSEWLGGIASLKKCRLRSSTAYALGIVYAQVTANSLADTHLIVDSCEVEAGACDTLARVDFSAVPFEANASISDVTFTGSSASIGAILRMVGTGAAGDGDYVSVHGIRNAPVGTSLYLGLSGYGATVKASLMAQHGVATITPVSAAAEALTAVTWRYSYGSKTPVVQATAQSGAVNSKTVVAYAGSVTNVGANITLRTADSANMGVVTPTVSCGWSAAVCEI